MSEEGKVSRAFVIPVGRSVDDSGTVVRIAFLQSCDAYLPSKIAKWEGLFKGIGGAVEANEKPWETIARELEEEHPGWLKNHRLPGTSKGWGGSSSAVNGYVYLCTEKGFCYFAVLCDVGIGSFRSFVQCCSESSPISMSANRFKKLKSEEFNPGMHQALTIAFELLGK